MLQTSKLLRQAHALANGSVVEAVDRYLAGEIDQGELIWVLDKIAKTWTPPFMPTRHYRVEPGHLGRVAALQLLSTNVLGSDSVVVVDPYFFSGLDCSILAEFCSIIGGAGSTVKRIHVVCNERNTDKVEEPRRIVIEALSTLGVNLTLAFTNLIHDRAWIFQSEGVLKGLALGTSFNGFGKKLTFILKLPKEDLEEWCTHLLKSNLAPTWLGVA